MTEKHRNRLVEFCLNRLSRFRQEEICPTIITVAIRSNNIEAMTILIRLKIWSLPNSELLNQSLTWETLQHANPTLATNIIIKHPTAPHRLFLDVATSHPNWVTSPAPGNTPQWQVARPYILDHFAKAVSEGISKNELNRCLWHAVRVVMDAVTDVGVYTYTSLKRKSGKRQEYEPEWKYSILHAAVCSNTPKVVQMILDCCRVAGIMHTLTDDRSCLCRAAARGDLGILDVLVKAGLVVEGMVVEMGALLVAAAEKGKVDMARWIFGRRVEKDVRVVMVAKALLIATYNGHVDFVRYVASNTMMVLSMKLGEFESGDDTILLCRLTNEACPTVILKDALACAGAKGGSSDILEYFLSLRANPWLLGNDAISEAATHRYADVVEILLRDHSALAEYQTVTTVWQHITSNYYSHICLPETSPLSQCKLLRLNTRLRKLSPKTTSLLLPPIPTSKSNHPVSRRTIEVHRKITHLLPTAGTDVHYNNDEALRNAFNLDLAPDIQINLRLACDIQTIKILLDHGANPNVNNGEPLTNICGTMYPASTLQHQPAILKLLLDAGADVHFGDDNALCTLVAVPLHAYPRQITASTYTTVLRMLLDAGADPQARDNYPLQTLAKQRWTNIRMNPYLRDAAVLLLERGADVHAGDEEALFSAIVAENEALIMLLIDWGADVNARGGEALVVARRTRSWYVERMIERARGCGT
ncbi:hypothetical protein HDV00_012257 [Rhizophlyctis rosea]|nr:hypothetical protein HDV00_012257 [Rhizophlyctis rosea]